MKAVVAAAFGLLILVALTAVATGTHHVAPPKPQAPNCQTLLSAPKHGKDAVTALGSNISTVAARHGKGAADLSKQLLSDASVWVDPCGEEFVQEKDEIPVDPPQDASTLIFPRSQTFTLHSKAGSSKVLYIDFNGELVSGTAWNATFNSGQDIAAAAYDTDGSPSTFNDDETAIIQNVWLRVAEDYAPFDIDVTTQDPGLDAIDRTDSTDNNFGAHAIVTGDTTIFNQCGCAGISYVGVFNMGSSHQYYQPSWIFESATGANAKVIGEVVSHEVGHQLGLSHEGTQTSAYYSGQGSWAPIMGTSYNRPISQWSKGEYSGANNTEDEFAVMEANGLSLRADSVGNTVSAATSLQSGVQVDSRINSAADTDWFSISGSGQINIVANVAPTSPDLDLGVWVYDASGNLVGKSDPPAQTVSGDQATGLSVNSTFTLPAYGKYYLKLDGVGFGDPTSSGYSDYASVGDYSLTVTIFDPSTSPQITTTSLPPATYGTPYSATLGAANGVPPYSFGIAGSSAAGLPDGLTLANNTGLISGTPTGAAGTYNISFKVQDKQSNSTVAILPIVVSDAPLTITSSIPLPAASYGVAYSYQLTASGARSNYVWSVASGTIPAGLTLTTSGLLSGTPTRATSYSFTIRATSGSATTTKSLSMAVTNPLKVTTSTMTDAYVNLAYSAALAASGGSGSYVWDIASGNLPAGMYLSGNYVKGTPTTPGSTTFTARATDSAGRVVTGNVTINVYGPVSITSDPALPSGTIGTPYSFQMTATGGKQPYYWTKYSGTLPSGLSIATNGVLGGKTNYAGTYTVVLKVTDASKKFTATQTLTLTINKPDTPLSITTSSLPAAKIGTLYSTQLTAAGGVPGYTWSRVSGSLPRGMSVSSAGVLSGTPTAAATITFVFKCTDAAAEIQTITLVLSVTT
jgi:hypothetical protein